MSRSRGCVDVRWALVSLLVGGGAMAQALTGSSLTVNSPVVTYGALIAGTLSGGTDGPSCKGTTVVDFNNNSSWYATGGMSGVTSTASASFLASYYPNKDAILLGGHFIASLTNGIQAGAEANGPYYISGVRGVLAGSLPNSSFNGVAAAVSGVDLINRPITYAAHFTGKSYFSDGLRVASGAGTGGFAGYFNGNVFATAYYVPSDASLKQDVRPLQDALGRLMQLQPKTYTFSAKASGLATHPGQQVGLMAQEVEAVFPQFVKKTALTDTAGQLSGDFKAVDYLGLIPVLIKGIQEQQDILQQQQARILQLEASLQRQKR